MTSVPQTETFAAAQTHSGSKASAVRSVASHLRFWPVAVIGLALDLWSKHWAFATLDPQTSKVIIPGWLNFQLSLNPGALFGIGRGYAPLFVGASVLALMFVVYLFVHSTPRHRSMHVALGLVLAGAIGNLYDRTMVTAFVWDSPRTRQHQVGVLLEQQPDRVKIGDYPTEKNPHWYSLGPNVTTGIRPVVRDFIRFDMQIAGVKLWPWIFNIADALLVVGVAILLMNFWLERREEPPPAPQTIEPFDARAG